MELPTDVGIREGIMTGLVGLVGWCWKKMNGTLSREEFKSWLEAHEKKIETQRVEFRQSIIDIFQEMRTHTANDAKAFTEIKSSLATLEERSKQRRSADHGR